MQKEDVHLQIKIKNFNDLIAWKKGHALVLDIYNLTSNFPKIELYSLIDQMRRCSVSVTSNIAEGFSRKGKREKIQFYYTSLGSLTELQNQIFISKDLNYIDQVVFDKLTSQTIEVQKLVNGLIKSSLDHA